MMKKNFILAAIALALVACGQKQADECISTFEDLSLITDNVGDFRMGE